MRRALTAALVAVLACFVLPAVAAAEPCPQFNGGYMFTDIQGPEDPEDYCWEVTLNPGQKLQQVDDQEIDVISKTGAAAWVIDASPARDAEGASVPTTVLLTGETEFTLTVHHRAGNPAASGAPFRYPITTGESYKTGPATVVAQLTEEEPPPDPPAATTPTCTVPTLLGKSWKASRKALQRANCTPGPVHGEHRRGARVVRQYQPAGKTLPAGTAVGVKLGR